MLLSDSAPQPSPPPPQPYCDWTTAGESGGGTRSADWGGAGGLMPEPLCFRSGVGSARSCGPRQPDPRRGRRLDGGQVGVQVTHSFTAEHDFRSLLAAGRVATSDTWLTNIKFQPALLTRQVTSDGRQLCPVEKINQKIVQFPFSH